MDAEDFQRFRDKAAGLFQVDPDLISAIAHHQRYVDDVECIHGLYASAVTLWRNLHVFEGCQDNALRATHSGVNPTAWTEETEVFLQKTNDLVCLIKRSKEKVSAEPLPAETPAPSFQFQA